LSATDRPPETAERKLTQAMLERLARCPDARLRELLSKLVETLHRWASEVRLTEEEWWRAIEFLTATGQKCDAERQEFVLLSDVLGLSALVNDLAHPSDPDATDATLIGPFFRAGAPRLELGATLGSLDSGTRLRVSGAVTDSHGTPLRGAEVDVWQADGEGLYDVQRSDPLSARAQSSFRGRFETDANGRFWFWTVRPTSYSIPTDGPVGNLLRHAELSPFRPAHIHFRIAAPGHIPLVTHLFAAGDPHLDSDAVQSVHESLIVPFDGPPTESDAATSATSEPFTCCEYTFRLKPLTDPTSAAC